MKVSVLYSDSAGNSLYAESAGTRLLVDAGQNRKCLVKALAAIERTPETIDALLLTHEHIDHVGAVAVLEKQHRIPLYASSTTAETLCREWGKKAEDWDWRIFEPGESFMIGDIGVEAFAVPHDACDPVGYTLTADGEKLGVATDLGEAPMVVRHHLKGCNGLVLEFNHDHELLMNCDRPWRLKQRISGRSGHLSNAQAAAVLAEVAHENLHLVLPYHLSNECNEPTLVRQTIREVLSGAGLDGRVSVRLPPYPTELLPLRAEACGG